MCSPMVMISICQLKTDNFHSFVETSNSLVLVRLACRMTIMVVFDTLQLLSFVFKKSLQATNKIVALLCHTAV